MMRTLKFLLSSQIKHSKLIQQVGGFTLIELLVAMILAFLVITPLLGFMINIMNTDRQEQAKANSEQEIQAALDYISRDLQQAIYIYDDTGINAIKAQLPTPSGTVPVLVFWKREFVTQAITTDKGNDDTFVYSLVAYYLIKDDNPTWSKAARIGRWQIKDGVPDASSKESCGKYVKGQCPSAGFTPFKLDKSGTIEEKMNAWTKAAADYTDSVTPLVDFVDQSTKEQNKDKTQKLPPKKCLTGSLVPPTSFNTTDTYKMTSFYACIDRVNTTAQVFLRGNALARLQNDNLEYVDKSVTYFPNASIRVQGRGYLFTK